MKSEMKFDMKEFSFEYTVSKLDMRLSEVKSNNIRSHIKALFKELFGYFELDCEMDNSAYSAIVRRRKYRTKDDISELYPQNKFLTAFAALLNNSSMADSVVDKAIEKAVGLIVSILQISSLDKKAQEEYVEAFINAERGQILDNEQIENALKMFVRNIFEDDDDEHTATAITWLLLISVFPNWISEIKELKRRAVDHSKHLLLYIGYSDIWSKYLAQLEQRKLIDTASENCFELSDSHPEVTAAILGVAMEICDNEKKYGRLIPVEDAEKNRPIEIPDLENDSVSNKDKETLSLKKIIETPDSFSVMLTGEGGCGKTYALLHCASEIIDGTMALDRKRIVKNEVIPLYVPLSRLDANVSNPIEKYFTDRLSVHLHCDSGTSWNEFNVWLDERKLGNITFLCDGFNEVVSLDMQVKLITEIKHLASRKGIRFVITSRYNMSQTFSEVSGDLRNNVFRSYRMMELADDYVKEYTRAVLENANTDKKTANAIIRKELCNNNQKVKPIYKKPMGLIMFCGIHLNYDYGHTVSNFIELPSKTGELLHNFIYCIKSVYSNTASVHDFLCYIGFRMNTEGVFGISTASLKIYLKEFSEKSTNAPSLSELNASPYLKDVLKQMDNSYVGFRHQNYRDYFAAEYLKGIITSGDCKAINEEIGVDKRIPQEVLIILSEILGEHRYKNDPSEIQMLLLKYGRELSASAIALLLQLVVIGRNKDLSGFVFQELDLSMARLNGVMMSKPASNGAPKTAKFIKCVFSDETLMPVGHAGAPHEILYLEDRFILTLGKGCLCAFDMKKGTSYIAAPYENAALYASIKLPGQPRFITGDSDGVLTLWEYSVGDEKLIVSAIVNYSITDNNYAVDDRKKRELCSVYDMVLSDDGIVIACYNGDIFTADIGLEGVRQIFDLSETVGAFFTICRVEKVNDTLFFAYGNNLFVRDGDALVKVDIPETDNGYIYDLAAVFSEDCYGLLINFRSEKSSSVLLYDTDNKSVSRLMDKSHSVSSQGFFGWNKFSPPFNNGSSVYLTADINDTEEEAGLYRFSFNARYDSDEEVYCGLEYVSDNNVIFGGRYTMQVARALHFEYNGDSFVATTCLDRSVEILTEGPEYNLIYHLPGHTDGITSLAVVDSDTIYTSHYCGEVCRWRKGKDGKWKCKLTVKPHSDQWVWVVKHIAAGSARFMIAGSYDHNISITNAKTGKIGIINDCKGIVKTFDFIDNDTIVAVYDFKDGNEYGFELCVIRDFFNTKAAPMHVKKYSLSHSVRFVKTFGDIVYFIINKNTTCEIHRISTKTLKQAVNKKLFGAKPFYTIESPTKKVLMRAIDMLDIGGRTLYACGGDIGTYYVELWTDSDHRVALNQAPGRVVFDNKNSDRPDGVSALKLAEYGGKLYFFACSYNSDIYTYEVKLSDSGDIELKYISTCKNSDKVMDLQAGQNSELYIALLSGEVYELKAETLITNGEYSATENGKLLFRAISGLGVADVGFGGNTVPRTLEKHLKYYAKD